MTTQQQLFALVNNKVGTLLEQYLPRDQWPSLGLTDNTTSSILRSVNQLLMNDITALVNGDAAARPEGVEPEGYVIGAYTTVRAIIHYRFANEIHNCRDINRPLRVMIARKVSEDGKVSTGVEIHPSAQIGDSFVIDHGIGTVIGGTCVIGDECYILNNVTLGATRMSGSSPQGRRHPMIGNRVHIGGSARVYGPVSVGDGVVINPHCVVIQSIPANHKVSIINQLQVCKSDKGESFNVYGVVPSARNARLTIYGTGLSGAAIRLVEIREASDDQEKFAEILPVSEISCTILSSNTRQLTIGLEKIAPDVPQDREKSIINAVMVCERDGISTMLLQCSGLREAMKRALQRKVAM